MLSNYLKVALRNLNRYKGYALINVAGLSVGIACCLLTLLCVQGEWSFDRFHAKADRIYRARMVEDYGENQRHFNIAAPLPPGPTPAETFPEVEAFARFMAQTDIVRRGATSFREPMDGRTPSGSTCRGRSRTMRSSAW